MASDGLLMAKTYLQRSNSLREALGIAQVAQLEPCPLGQGEHNANFTFKHPESGEVLVLRINYASQMNLEHQIEYEASALRVLELSTRTPHLLFVDGSKRIVDHGVLVMEHRRGSHLDFDRPGDIDEAACILADIHAVVPDEAPLCPLIDPEDALCDLCEENRRMFEAYCASPLVDVALARRIEGFFSVAEPLATRMQTPLGRHVLNTEAVPSHFLIPDDGTLGSMVDWEKPIIGDVARDVAYFTAPTTTIWDTDFLFDAAGRKAFVERYWRAVDGRFSRSGFDERFDTYLKMNCLRGMTWSMLAWTEYHDPARPLQNEKTREKLEVYLSESFIDLLARDIFGIA